MRRGLVCLMVLAFASVAAADHVNIVLEATPPADGPCYQIGEEVGITVSIESFWSTTEYMRQVAFSSHGMEEPCVSGFVGDVAFDGADIPFGGFGYNQFPSWPSPALVTTATSGGPQHISVVPGGVYEVAHFTYVIPEGCGPDECPDPACPGACTLDIINTGTEIPDLGGRMTLGFDPSYDLTVPNGMITGGTITLCCIPEPASLALLGLGMLAVLRRR